MVTEYSGMVQAGEPTPLGAHFDGAGTNFAVFTSAATTVTLCLIDDEGEETQIPVTTQDGTVWHCYVPGIIPGQRYGYRIDGAWDPQNGQFCNPAKFLADPYARAFDGHYSADDALLPYQIHHPDLPSDSNSLPHSMTSVVVGSYYDWGDDRPLRHTMTDTVIYETHVRGATATHPAIPPELRGTYAGLAHPVFLEHLTSLGVTALELLPVHQFFHDRRLREMGLRNYWGYNTVGFFAPHRDYASQHSPGAPVAEFRNMVKALHKAGIEVILDVVYNHTAEGNAEGPMLCFRGLDNHAYYALEPDNPSAYRNVTGCGNSINIRHPHTLQLVLDSLRYWVTEMHVDGFRFDLATTLLRDGDTVDHWGNFLSAVHQDPILREVKLIAEPWDLGYDGYQVGAYPYPWSEWNGKFRDTLREFWCGNPRTLGECAGRLTGSADLFAHNGRRPCHSINFITAHDGFTLNDLVTYEQKRNEANGEDNRDGESYNRNWNCGEEGPSTDPTVLQIRRQQKKNLLASLILSQGTPMMLYGDECCRTQQGNNNAYCQDNPLTWINWETILGEPQDDDALEAQEFLRFSRYLLLLRKQHPIFRQNSFFTGKNVPADRLNASLLVHHQDADHPLTSLPDVLWINRQGKIMEPEDWENADACTLTVFLNGHANRTPNPLGGLYGDSSFIFLLNASPADLTFHIPTELLSTGSGLWNYRVDTTLFAEDMVADQRVITAETPDCPVPAHSLILLEQEPSR